MVSDLNKEAVAEAVSKGAIAAESMADLPHKLSAPRAGWVMVPSGDTHPILQLWDTGNTLMATYVPGSWGSTAADKLLAENGRKWRYNWADHD